MRKRRGRGEPGVTKHETHRCSSGSPQSRIQDRSPSQLQVRDWRQNKSQEGAHTHTDTQAHSPCPRERILRRALPLLCESHPFTPEVALQSLRSIPLNPSLRPPAHRGILSLSSWPLTEAGGDLGSHVLCRKCKAAAATVLKSIAETGLAAVRELPTSPPWPCGDVTVQLQHMTTLLSGRCPLPL